MKKLNELKNSESAMKNPESVAGGDFPTYWLKALIDSAEDAIISQNLDGTITSWNKSAARIFGYTETEAVGQTAQMLIPAERAAEEKEILDRIKRGEHVERFETIRKRKNGSSIDVSLSFSPILNDRGKIVGASKIAREIAHIREAREQIKFSEERYRKLFDSIDEGFCIIQMMFDRRGKAVDYLFLEVNPVFEEQTGLVGAEGKTMRSLIPNHDDSWFEIYGRVALTGEPIRFENRAEVLDSWFDLYAFRIGNPDENKVAVLFKNITERKRAEQTLVKSDARLRLALDIAQTSTFEINLITDEVETDQIGREIYGFMPDEPLTFTKIQSRFHPDDSNYVMDSVALAVAPEGEDEFEVEQRIVRTDGEIRWIKVRGRVFFEGAGDNRIAALCLGTYIDITENKKAEAERERLLGQLDAERSRLNYLFENAPAFVATLRGPDHIFELTNPAYRQLIGHRDVVGKPLREALPEIENQGFVELLDKVFHTGESYIGREIPVNLQRAPGNELEQRLLDFVYQPIFEAENKVSGIFVHGIDVTEQVEARQTAESANRTKDEFLATLSHELRTPLNSILGWTRLLTAGHLDEKNRTRAIETIERNARIQSQLIDDLLDVSRIISGKLKLEIEPVDLTELTEQTIDSIIPAVQAKEIKLIKSFTATSLIISGDSNRIRQIFWNLLSNAVKFTPPSGTIEVKLERETAVANFIVADSGIGISQADLPFVFDRFRQVNSAINRKHGGLGLAIVRHLTDMHGGNVFAESAGDGQGSIFKVAFPLSSEF